MLRFIILIVAFTLVVLGLPQFGPAVPYIDMLRRVPSSTVMMIDIAALAVAFPILHFMTRQPAGWLYTRDTLALRLGYNAALGVVVAGLFDLFEVFSGYAITLDGLVLLPLAFVTGELAYQIVIRFVSRQQSERIAPRDAPTDDTHDTPSGSRKDLPRLFITLPIYAFVVVFLPQQDEFRQFERTLLQVSPLIALGLSIGAILLGVAIFTLYGAQLKRDAAQIASNDTLAREKLNIRYAIMMTLIIGLAMAALINIVGYGVGYPPSLSLLILMPLGFVVAEIIYALLNWRIKYGASDT